MSKILNSVGRIMNRLMLSCNEATLLITKSDFVKLDTVNQFKLKMHLMSCSMCKDFKAQSLIITSQLNEFKNIPNPKDMNIILTEDKKRALQDIIDQSDPKN